MAATTVDSTIRRCRRCGVVREHGRDRTRPDGLAARCKVCERRRMEDRRRAASKPVRGGYSPSLARYVAAAQELVDRGIDPTGKRVAQALGCSHQAVNQARQRLFRLGIDWPSGDEPGAAQRRAIERRIAAIRATKVREVPVRVHRFPDVPL